ncbi:Uncharacterized protein TCM_026098 [Theobroma cacao]|uniref:Uncharacterized protein n=1 Tax=Theobroma cacao TaxID=3641 RepID=A0A061F286_THECC|nr:Uncharacterized protein TCM_026098 [Theobroma cacao]
MSCRSFHGVFSGCVIHKTTFLESDSMIIPVEFAHEEAENKIIASLTARISARLASPQPAFFKKVILTAPLLSRKTPPIPRWPGHPLAAPSVLNLSQPAGGHSQETMLLTFLFEVGAEAKKGVVAISKMALSPGHWDLTYHATLNLTISNTFNKSHIFPSKIISFL